MSLEEVLHDMLLPPLRGRSDTVLGEGSVVSKNTNDSGLLVTLEPTSDGDDQQGSELALPPHDRGF